MTVATALQLYRDTSPDVVVLDIMLPDTDGIRLLRQLREIEQTFPTLFLTARDSVDDRIIGLTAGGDDYMTKPFSLEELVARLRGLLRRSILTSSDEDSRIIGRRPAARRDELRGQPRRRTHPAHHDRVRAAALLSCATLGGCSVAPRSSTGSGTTTSPARPASSTSTSRTCARRSTPDAPPMIHTVRGVGYMLRPVGMSAPSAVRAPLDPASPPRRRHRRGRGGRLRDRGRRRRDHARRLGHRGRRHAAVRARCPASSHTVERLRNDELAGPTRLARAGPTTKPFVDYTGHGAGTLIALVVDGAIVDSAQFSDADRDRARRAVIAAPRAGLAGGRARAPSRCPALGTYRRCHAARQQGQHPRQPASRWRPPTRPCCRRRSSSRRSSPCSR